ncbi:MAG: hypothetical protein Q9181_004940 [Wetmoreana brouardii]
MDHNRDGKVGGVIEHYIPTPTAQASPSSSDVKAVHRAPELIKADDKDDAPVPVQDAVTTAEELEASHNGWFAYFKTRDFYIVLGLGQILALCITSTNTFSSLLASHGTSIPAFQTLLNYILLNIIYTPYTLYRRGPRNYFRNLLLKDGWKYIILSFLDVQGNYFTVLAYRYTTILSAQLINFFAIVTVVAVSFLFLHVRYHVTQVAGILICIGGVGILIASDHITGASSLDHKSKGSQVKGDLFALLGATCYGFSNVAEEFLTSKRPLYEVVGQIGFWGMLINGVQAAIFDRASFRTAVWDGKTGGYLTGYTLILSLFYSLAPLMFRLASAAFFNISLLTGNFWGVCIGVKVFHLHIHWMYPIAFVCIVGGLLVYFIGKRVLGEARKPWLGRNQEEGVVGVGTARRRVVKGDTVV